MLPFFDRIEKLSEEYWNLDIMDQERVLEADEPGF